MVLAVGGTLLSAALSQPSVGINVTQCGDIDNVSMCAEGTCPSDQACVAFNASCGCQPTGCCDDSQCAGAAGAELGCAQAAGPLCANTTSVECSGVFYPGGACTVDGCVSATPTATATATATETATASQTPTSTRGGDGAMCVDPNDCISGNCVDDVCCDTACDQPEQACNLPGNEGVCSSVAAPAPAASPTGLLIGGLLLVLIAAVGFARRQSPR
ncbi:MAG: hypothetical protein SF182_13175 [Deltaproteobacteria bacterium]|nr:hypothetical protein [Deltaproteobacteria bacterium]